MARRRPEEPAERPEPAPRERRLLELVLSSDSSAPSTPPDRDDASLGWPLPEVTGEGGAVDGATVEAQVATPRETNQGAANPTNQGAADPSNQGGADPTNQGAVANQGGGVDAAAKPTLGDQRQLARSVSFLSLLTVVHALVLAAIGGLAGYRWAQGRGAVFEAVVAVVSSAVALWSMLGAFHLRLALARPRDAAHQLAVAMGNLRSLFILKAIGLFLVLALSCFTLSVAAMLLSP